MDASEQPNGAGPRSGSALGRFLSANGVLIGFLLLTLVLGLRTPGFWTPENFRNVSTQVAANLIIAVGMTLVIITGGIDLSVGSIVGVAGVAAVMALISPALAATLGPTAVPVGVGVGLLAGALVGLANGAAIAYFRLPPFIVTLAAMMMMRGLAKILVGGVPIGFVGAGEPYAEQLNANLQTIQPLGLRFPVPFLIALGVTVIGAVMLSRSRLGRHIYALGGSESAARLSGIEVARVKLLVYGISGLLAGLAGVMEAAKVQSGSPVAGSFYELNAIAAVVVGGASLAGGRGSVVGTFVGAVFVIGVMNNMLGLRSATVPTFWKEFLSGAIIFTIVLLDQLRRRRLE